MLEFDYSFTNEEYLGVSSVGHYKYFNKEAFTHTSVFVISLEKIPSGGRAGLSASLEETLLIPPNAFLCQVAIWDRRP